MTGAGFSILTSCSRPCGFGSASSVSQILPLAAEQHRRRDVLVETKEVGRVVARLQGNEPVELALAVRRPDPVWTLVAHPVRVATARRERLHRVPQRPRPG